MPRCFNIRGTIHALPPLLAAALLAMNAAGCRAEPKTAEPPDPATGNDIEEQAPAGDTQPAVAEPTPATQPADPQTIDWLTRIEARAATLVSLRAKVRYDAIKGLQRDRQRRFGTILYAPGPPARFNARFTSLIVDDRKQEQDRAYIFDGQWLVERLADQKLFIKRQVVGPDTPPDKADPLRFGEGPFALPITLHKDEILARFHVALIAPSKDDPTDTVRIRFEPLPGRRTTVERIDVWYHREKLLPLRAVTTDDSENQTIVDLSDVKLDEPFTAADFDTAEPKDSGWRVEVKPWEPEAR